MSVDSSHVYTLEKDHRVYDYVECNWSFITSLISGYLFMVHVWGPKFMKNRKPYDLLNIVRVYNVMQICGSFYFGFRLFYQFYVVMGNSIICTPPDKKTDKETMMLFNLGYYFFYLRIFDFADTLFFILRKKQNQVTFLHVFHHVIVVFSLWITCYYGLHNYVILTGSLNSLIHGIMYSYYFLSTLGPSIQPYLWWKKHLTKLQIAQFLVMLVHLSIPMIIDCGYPVILTRAWFACITSILALFVHFYIKSYSARSIKMTTKSA